MGTLKYYFILFLLPLFVSTNSYGDCRPDDPACAARTCKDVYCFTGCVRLKGTKDCYALDPPIDHMVNGTNSGWCYPLYDNTGGKLINNISLGFMSYRNDQFPYHYAQDITQGYKEGAPVFAMADGEIIIARKSGGYGGGTTKGDCDSYYNTLVTKHKYYRKDGSVGDVYIFYGHIQNIIDLPQGSTSVTIKKGHKIAELNNPSCAGYPVHLHLTIMPDTLPSDYFDGYNNTQNMKGRVRGFNCSNNKNGTWSKDWVDKDGVQKIPVNDMIFFDTYSGIPTTPTPKIQANGQDGPITVTAYSPLSITVSLAPGDQNGKNADWWAVKLYNNTWFSLTPYFTWALGINPVAQMPLCSFSPVQIYNANTPVGEAIFCFGVDMCPNGILDSPLYYDCVSVNGVN